MTILIQWKIDITTHRHIITFFSYNNRSFCDNIDNNAGYIMCLYYNTKSIITIWFQTTKGSNPHLVDSRESECLHPY